MSLENKYGNVTNAIAKMIGTIPTGFNGIGSVDVSCTFPCLAYTTGISFCDLRMNIVNKMRPNTTTSIKAATPPALADHPILVDTCWTIPDTIDAKIKNDTPFPIPFSVIISPKYINNNEPIVRANADISTVPIVVSITLPPKR